MGPDNQLGDLRRGVMAELKKTVVPVLRSRGFVGNLPHLRREREGGIDVMTFQFDRHGGGFVIELGRFAASGFRPHWGEIVVPSKLETSYLRVNDRFRIKRGPGGSTRDWFRFEDGDFDGVAASVLDKLPTAEVWWASKQPIGGYL